MTTRMTMRMSLMKFMATQSLGAVDDGEHEDEAEAGAGNEDEDDNNERCC